MRSNWYIAVAALLSLFVACEGHTARERKDEVDSLNARAYSFRYVNIDSTSALAHRALTLSDDYNDGLCESWLNLAFVEYQQMNFDRADSILRLVRSRHPKTLLRLCGNVMQMKTCQRTGHGDRFFQAKSRAEERMALLAKQEGDMSPHDVALWVYARTEFHIIASTYYFYQEQDAQARAELEAVPPCLRLHVDTVQWVYYNYMLGPGGLVEGRDAQDITLQEFDYLFRAYISSRRDSLHYFEANSLQAFATMFLTNDSLLQEQRPDAYNLLRFQHTDWQAEQDGLPLAFARHALSLFQDYNDLFQTACTYRTLGEIYFQQQDYEKALSSYTQALHCVNLHHLRYYGDLSPDTLSAFNPDDVGRSVEKEWIDDPRISTVPEWIAGIRQQLSLVFSAMDMKQASDYNRNSYLDLLLASNQDLELENRTQELERETRTLYGRILWCLGALLVVWLAAWVIRWHMKRRNAESQSELDEGRWEADAEFRRWVDERIVQLQDEREEAEERLQMAHRGVTDNKRKNAENRAKVSLVHGIVPFLDRIGGEVLRMKRDGTVGAERREYIIELVDEIERYNTVLTEWIKLEQGQLNLRITTFPLDKLFRIVAEGHYAFDQKQIRLQVDEVASLVKADESLTLFMINTLADNARKFTPADGRVTLSAEETDEYVEIQVSDTGCGLSPEDVDTITNSKVYDASEIGQSREGKGFGFGLMNCRGIIEKYKKTSSLFACCAFGVRSRLGQGSTFYFRLPRVLRLVLLFLCWPLFSQADEVTMFYDSLYQANLTARYADALRYAERVIGLLNREHPGQPPMTLYDADPAHHESAEMMWAKAGEPSDYELIVGLRNEVALAALSLHDFPLYHYNNRACIRLHKFIHQDATLPTYFHEMERAHRRSNLLFTLSFLLALALSYVAYRLLISREITRRRGLIALKVYLSNLYMQVQRKSAIDGLQFAFARRYPEAGEWAETYRRRIEADSLMPMQRLNEDISHLSDEQARLDFEQNRLHVQNLILDNCLSTIKHESMYYPSRIRLLAEKMQEQDIRPLSELVQYYHHIYTLLCQQADEQVSQPGYKRQSVPVDRVIEASHRVAQRLTRRWPTSRIVEAEATHRSDARVVADEILLSQLMESLLQEMMSHEGARLSISAVEDGNFIRFVLRDEANTMPDEYLANLFFPDVSHIPCLVAKQILREHDTYANHPGCRLVAQSAEEGGYEIFFTLLRIMP